MADAIVSNPHIFVETMRRSKELRKAYMIFMNHATGDCITRPIGYPVFNGLFWQHIATIDYYGIKG